MSIFSKEYQDKYIIYVPETDEGYIGTYTGFGRNVEDWQFFYQKKSAEQALKQYCNGLKKQIKKLSNKKNHIEKNANYNLFYLEVNDELAKVENTLKLMENAVIKRVRITLTEVEDGE